MICSVHLVDGLRWVPTRYGELVEVKVMRGVVHPRTQWVRARWIDRDPHRPEMVGLLPVGQEDLRAGDTVLGVRPVPHTSWVPLDGGVAS